MINYVVAFFLGDRRNSGPHIRDELFYLKKHVEFLLYNKNSNVFPTFVFNGSEGRKNLIREIVKDLDCQVIYRPNVNFSYGAWNDAIIANLEKKYAYFFLIEDDYLPVSMEAIGKFKQGILEKNSHAGAISLYSDLGGHPPHAAISNGMLSRSACVSVKKKYKTIFELSKNNDYINAEWNQINYLNMFLRGGHSFKNMSEDYSFDFYDGKVIKKYGDGEILVRPIL